MPFCDAERNSVLVKVIAYGDFSAKGVPTSIQRKPSQIIRVSLDQNWNVQSGKLNRVGDALFIAEVGQNNKDAIDPFPVLIKERSTLFCILPSLHSAEFRRLLVNNNGFDTAFREHLQDIATALSDQGIGEKIPVTYNDAKRNRSILGHKIVVVGKANCCNRPRLYRKGIVSPMFCSRRFAMPPRQFGEEIF
jgi:hypothetical protein